VKGKDAKKYRFENRPMKISQLFAAFQRFAETHSRAGAAAPPETPPARPPRLDAEQGREPPPGGDRITVSPEAIFTFAASRFDPRRITRNEVGDLADVLRDGGAISNHDHALLAAPPDGRIRTSPFEIDPGASTNLVTEFQGRLAFDLAHSNIAAVESDTRALAILGRLASIREEIL
jgi:hypothetical protein